MKPACRQAGLCQKVIQEKTGGAFKEKKYAEIRIKNSV